MIIDRIQVAAALPGYELGTTLGKGGFGLVLAARHRELGRPVAIKVVSAGSTPEARLLASMDHPHIVRVHDYVEAEDLCLVVMELLEGGTLARRAAGMTPEAACAAGLAVAAALSCAHGMGVLHRDVKPGNVLFDAAGLLKVTDFGIAKIVEGSAATASAAGVGTPAYMAPEQILGGRLGPATDIYALGVLLYQLLTGAPPFDPTLPVQALWQHHLGTTPAPPAGVPAPVAQVVLAALAKDLAARPSSARDFALDLARAAAGTYGPRWTTRSGLVLRLDDEVRDAAGDHRPPPAATPVFLGPQPPGEVTTPGPAPVAPPDSRVAPEPPPAGSPQPTAGREPARSPAEHSADSHPAGPAIRLRGAWSRQRRLVLAGAVALLLAAGTALAFITTSGGNPPPARPATSAPQAPTPTLPPPPRPLGRPLTGHTDTVTSVAFSPDGATLASGSDDNTVRLWDVSDPAAPRSLGRLLTGHTFGVASVALSAAGDILATGSGDGTVRLWNVADRSAPRPLDADPAAPYPLGRQPQEEGRFGVVWSVAFSPNGAILATGGGIGKGSVVLLWDVADPAHPRALSRLTGHTESVRSVAFSSDGRTLATGSWDNTARLWDIADPAAPRSLSQLTGHAAPVQSVAFSSDGTILASGSRDDTVRLWDVTDPAHPRTISRLSGRTGDVWSVVFSPDGTTLASSTDDGGIGQITGTVRLWDVADPAHPHELATLEGHTDWVPSMAFSPDGATLATGSFDNTVRLWAVR